MASSTDMTPPGLPAPRVVDVGGGWCVFVGLGTPRDVSDEAMASWVGEAVTAARALGGHHLGTRPIAAAVNAPYRKALEGAGFRYRGDRVEFKAPVSDLPGDEGSPITWRSMLDVGEAAAAAALALAAESDPHGLSPDDEPLDVIRGYLAEPNLIGAADCVQVGYLDGALAAFVCAQVDPSDGWSRVTYMGVVPSLRGRGLGRWVHRKGFALMKAQGGREYHGGTAAENPAMLQLFREHGCEEKWRMAEWDMKLGGAE